MDDSRPMWAPAREQEPQLIQKHWTYDEWLAWLDMLTPRLIVQHMRRWSLLAEDRVDLRQHLRDMIADARRALNQRNCHS